MAIDIEELTFSYGRRPLFANMTCALARQTCIIGANGAGKSTLLRLAGHILAPQHGRILVDAQDKYRAIFLCDSSILFDELTIRQHLRWIEAFYKPDSCTVHRVCKQFDIAEWLDKRPNEMSLGERQWNTLAIAFMIPCEIRLLDEPFRHLDDDRMTELCAILDHEAETGISHAAAMHTPCLGLNHFECYRLHEGELVCLQ